MEISNKTLAWLVIAAIVVSIFGTTLSVMNMSGRGPAGYATSNTTGEAKVSVSQAVVLRFVSGDNSTDFGSGMITVGNNTCNMAVNTSAGTGVYSGCANFAVTPGPMILENVGTSYLNVTLNFSKNESDFLPINPGTGRGGMYFKFTVGNGTVGDGGCKALYNATPWAGWVDVPTVAGTQVNICGNLSWANGANKMLIGLNVSVNGNITTAAQNVIITAQGTAI